MLAHQPGDAAFQLTAENKPAVKDWLVAQGMDPARVEGMQDATLYKSYRFPSYLRQLKLRADYFPAYRKDDPPCQANTGPAMAGLIGRSATTISAPPVPIAATVPEAKALAHSVGPPCSTQTATPSSVGGSSNAVPDLIGSTEPAALIGFLASLMAQPVLTEARVVELIKEHLPRILIERLQLGEF